jgi:hypothetical protein
MIYNIKARSDRLVLPDSEKEAANFNGLTEATNSRKPYQRQLTNYGEMYVEMVQMV